MPTPFIQLEGVVKFGTTAGTLIDFSQYITNCIIRYTRDTVEKPGTYANAQTSQLAGTRNQEIEVNFINDLLANSFWGALWDALDTADSILYFEVHFDQQAQSTNHPGFTGQATITGTEVGGEVGSLRSTSETFPIVAGTLLRLDPS
jgi:hypothetical protein